MQTRGELCVFIETGLGTAHDRPCSPASRATHGAGAAPGVYPAETRSLRLRDILADDQTLRAAGSVRGAPRGRKPTEISCAVVDVPDVCPDGVGKGPSGFGILI